MNGDSGIFRMRCQQADQVLYLLQLSFHHVLQPGRLAGVPILTG